MDPAQDTMLFAALATVFTIFFILELRSVLKIVPYLFGCVLRWKYNMEIESSLQLSRSRDQVALTLVVPLGMLVYSQDLWSPDIIQGLSPTLRLCAVIAAVLFQMPLRAFLNWQFESHSLSSKVAQASNGSFYTFLVILFSILFTASAVTNAITSNPIISKNISLWVTAISYGVYVIRRGQILSSVCNPFVTFLYLCGLELLPAAALVLSAALL